MSESSLFAYCVGSANQTRFCRSNFWVAQTFHSDKKHTLTFLKLLMKASVGLPEGFELYVQIRTSSGDVPTSTILTSATFTKQQLIDLGLTDQYSYVELNLPDYELQEDTRYAIVCGSNNVGNFLTWGAISQDVCPNGRHSYCASEFGTFTPAATWDMRYEEWGYYSLTLYEILSFIPSWSRIHHAKKTFKESLNIIPFPNFSTIKILSEKLKLKEERFSLLQKELKETVSLIPKLIKGFSKSLKETLTLKDSFKHAIMCPFLKLYETLHLEGEITNPKFLYLHETLKIIEKKVFLDFPFFKRYRLTILFHLRKILVQFRYKKKHGIRTPYETTYKVKLKVTENN